MTQASTTNVRPAQSTDVDQLAQIWYQGWHEAHALLMPPELTRLRTLESFRERIRAALPEVRVAGPRGAPLGFSILKADELYQLYVSPHGRGAGVAASLIADAEAQLAARGFDLAWLGCAIGNGRAERFYEKSGWQQVGRMVYHSEVPNGTLPVEVWRYEKRLRGHGEPDHSA